MDNREDDHLVTVELYSLSIEASNAALCGGTWTYYTPVYTCTAGNIIKKYNILRFDTPSDTCPEGTVFDVASGLCIVPFDCDAISKSNEYMTARNSCFDIGGEFKFQCSDSGYSMFCEQPSFCSSNEAQNQIADARNLCSINAAGEPFTFTSSCSEQTRSVTTNCVVDTCTSLDCIGGGESGGGESGGGESGGGESGGGESGGGESGGGESGGGESGGGESGGGGTDPDCQLNCVEPDPPLPCDNPLADPNNCTSGSNSDLSEVILRLDTMTTNQLRQLEAMQQENAKTNDLNEKTKITNLMLERINVNQKIMNDKFDVNIKKNQAIYDTLDTMRANDLKGNANITDALDRSSTSNNKLLRDLNTSLGGLGNKLDELKPKEPAPEPDPEPEDSGMGKVNIDDVDKSLINSLFSSDKKDELKDEIAALDKALTDGIDSNIKDLKKSFTVSVSSSAQSDVGFNISVAGMSIAVPNPLTTWSKYYGEIGVIVMLLASMSALVIVCSKN
ncbi:hypothetical protein HWV00_17015 [Moritella sp. 24]|uniref:hypothetical protein n=1 Tax=Moritella sp. 24 TaxID=2746230 RepID=UPI001BA452EF|nr:hypothetical protein [Moritella sp. 24]QUM77785.1 hypothetical protein HWV00_17015 [Moritella sp. 24]